ncbi:hypothetical protein [Streptomyces sp. NPDC000410]|uniref:hypothetical protein n=1 Tax=Streptomyces sp. NPDC000410 TaxID=3154254 RepID=UPI00332F4777
MSGGKGDVAVSKTALDRIAKGIDKAHSELKDLNVGQQAVTGRGFSQLSLTGVQLGHSGLAEQFETFCERWGWGVRDLMQRANVLTGALGLSAGALHEQDQYVKGTIKIATNAFNGNPHLSEEDVKAKSWDEIKSQKPQDGADWSDESFSQAHSEVKQNWKDTAYDAQEAQLDDMERWGLIDPDMREATEQKMREELAPTEAAVERAKEDS